MKDTSCCLCGADNTHACGDDFLCNDCCINHMTTDGWRFDWIQKLIDHSHSMKLKLEEKE